jgi:hypothetical protein
MSQRDPSRTPTADYPIQFLAQVRTNGGQHAQITPANLWRLMNPAIHGSGVKVDKPLAMFTGGVQLALMGEAKSPADIARFNFLCTQEGLDVQTDLGYQPEVIEQQVQELARSTR